MGWSEQPLGASSQRVWSSSLAMPSRVAPEWCLLFVIVVFAPIPTPARANDEVDALYVFRLSMNDPSGAMASWNVPTVNPCSWFRVTCNADNSVVHVVLMNAGLSGTLVPQLGLLRNLRYLELFNNNISGPIPEELGNLSALVSLDLNRNKLTGPIPDSLGQLSNLRFLRLNNNSLVGPVPVSLSAIKGLQVLDLSYNNLTGEVPTNGSFSLFSAISFIGNKLCGLVLGIQCPGQPPFPLPAPSTQSSPPTPTLEEPESNRKAIVLASTISAAVVVIVVVGFTFIICRKQKHSGDSLKSKF